MSNVSSAVSDSATMLRRTLRHMLRNPFTIIASLGTPVFLLLLMVYVFGGAVHLGGAANAGTSYINYIAPGLFLITAIYGTGMTAVRATSDMTQGIIARFRTMAISRASVLTGHVVGGVIGTMISIGVIIGLALLMGFRPTAGPVEWIAAIGVIAMFVITVTWLSVALGLASKTPEGASSALFLLYVIPFVSSAFVPTNLMPSGIAWFAQNQPFTPIIATLRGLLMGTPIGNSAVLAVAWCAGLTLVGYLWARAVYNRGPVR